MIVEVNPIDFVDLPVPPAEKPTEFNIAAYVRYGSFVPVLFQNSF